MFLVSDLKTGKEKWVCPNKNEMARDMVTSVNSKRILFKYMLTDVWFSSAENMTFSRHLRSNSIPA